MEVTTRRLLPVTLAIALAACSTAPTRTDSVSSPVEERTAADAAASAPPPSPTYREPAASPEGSGDPASATESAPVLALLDRADQATGEGNLDAAAANLERALRIEPRNPVLWQRLARLRLQQGEYAQAVTLASRANGFAGSNNQLRAGNWRIIAEARQRMGDAGGAQAALQTAQRLDSDD